MPREVEFENPVREPGSGDACNLPASDGDRSPQSPEADAQRAADSHRLTFEAEPLALSDDDSRRTSRDRLSYSLLVVGTGILLPTFALLAVFIVWVAYLQPNALNVLATCVSLPMPAVMYTGYRGATRQSEATLRGYSFALATMITMQLSMFFVALLDDGTLADAYVDSCVVSFEAMCSRFGDLPIGASLITDALCGCLSLNEEDLVRMDNTTSGGDELSHAAVLSCIKDALMVKASSLVGVQVNVMFAGLSVVLVEAVLAFLAYNMIVDLDVKEARKAQKLQGGAPTGYIRGKIVGGSELRTREMNALEIKGQRKRRFRRKRNPAQQMSFLAAQLTVRTAGLHKSRKHHLVQTVQTHGAEDDCSPIWDQSFDNVVTYDATRQLEVTVYDQQGKRKEAVGSANVAIRGEEMPDLDHCMDGSGVVIDLSWTNPKTTQAQSAGSVTLQLAYIPTPAVGTSEANAVTSTWYFEVTVVGAVALNMVVLALQSPTVPAPVLLHGVLRVLEIFCATHMLMEFLLEFSVCLAAKTKWYHNRWLLLLAALIVVSWMSIVAPVLPISPTISESLTAETFTDGNLSTPLLDDTLYRASGAKTVPAARLIAEYVDQGAVSKVDDIKRVAKKLLSVFRVVRIARPVRTLRFIENIDIVINVITETATLLLTVVVLILFLLSMCTLIGQSSYSGALQYECMPQSVSGEQPKCNIEQWFSATLMQVDCPSRCPRSLSCAALHEEMWCAPVLGGRRAIGNDIHGFLDYDTFLRGFVATFVQMTGDGGMHSIPLALTASGASLAGTSWVISFITSVFLNMLCLNLFLAVLCSSYGEIVDATAERKLEKVRAHERYVAILKERGVEVHSKDEAQASPKAAVAISIEDMIHDKNWFTEGSRLPGAREWLKRVATALWFERATSIVIICNTISMALVHEDMDIKFRDTLRICEIGFLGLFISEAAIKLGGLGSSIFFRSAENKFDVFIITMSILGFIAMFHTAEIESLLGLEQRSLASMQSVRGVRLIRALQIMRLLQRQKALAAVLKTISLAWKPLFAHSCFCLFSISGLAIFGMHVLGGSLGSGATIEDYDSESPANLETFSRAALSFFEMFVGENWSHVMYWYTKYASMGHGFPHFGVQLFFLIAYVWVNCVLFSLCVAMMLENFTVAEEDKRPLQKRMYEKRMRANARKKYAQSLLQITVKESQRIGQAHDDGSSVFETLDYASNYVDLDALENKSLFLFKLNNPFRLWAAKFQESPAFSHGVTCLISFSCVSLAVEGPGEGSAGWAQETLGANFLSYINAAVLILFVLEACLKIVIHGLVLKSGPTVPYLGTRANRLDFFIILMCSISYIDFLPVNGAATRALRLGRVVTVIVNLAKHPSLKLVFISFARAGPDTAVVLLPLGIMALIFGTVGVARFGSQLKRCVSAAEPLMELHSNRTLCDLSPSDNWASPPFHFDDTLHAVATLFTALTDGAHEIMLETSDQGSVYAYTYWVTFHLCFTCFFLNLFIGVLSASFAKSSGTSLRLLGEKQWRAVQLTINHFRPRRSETEEIGQTERQTKKQTRCCWFNPAVWYKVREGAFAAATNSRLETCWRIGILVNSFILATDSYPRTERHENFIVASNDFFLGVCTLEVIIKLVGFGPKYYFSHGWLVSDFLLVVISISFKWLGVQSGMETLRMMRVFRLLVLLAKIPDLASLIETLVRCINASFALLLIAAVIVYLYAVIGMTLFGLLPEMSGLSESDEYNHRKAGTIIATVCPHCEAYTDVTNFSSFVNAVKLLVQCAFGQGIGQFIEEMQFLGADFWGLFIYFATFYGVSVWVCFNLLIVTVLDNFDAAIPPDMANTLTPEDFDGFAHCWAALTIGTHSSEAVESTSEAVLRRLAATLEEEATDMLREFVPPKTVEFETGLPLGVLTIRVQQIDELGDADVRPYCVVTARSTLLCGEEAAETPRQDVVNGSAVWPDDGVKIQMQIASNHTHLDFDVRNSYQFSNNRVGACSVPLEEVLRLCGSETNKSARSQLRDEDRSVTLKLMVDKKAPEPDIHGEADRWDRHIHLQHLSEDGTLLPDPTEDETVEDDFEDPDTLSTTPGLGEQLNDPEEQSNDPEIDLTKEDTFTMLEENLTKEEKKQRKREEKLRRKEEKRLRKAEKKAAKKAKKDAKRAAKYAKKHAQTETKTAGNLTPPGPEEEEKPPPHKFYAEGWVESGATLRLDFEFKRKVMLTQTTGFLDDYVIRYPNKEQNCGVEGWLEISENAGRFHKRFCYIQRYPVPCFKIVEQASTIVAVEGLATRGALKVHTIRGEHMLTVADTHTLKSSEEQETLIHVRNIGDVCQTENELRVVFSKFGHFVRANVRIRYDEDGNNTSWALVTLGNPEAARKALREVVTVHKDGLQKTLNINPFSKKQAAASTGGMKTTYATDTRVEFQLLAREPTGSGRKEEPQIGLISGTVVSATGLKSKEPSGRKSGVAVVELLDFNELSREHTEPEKLDSITVDDELNSEEEELEYQLGDDPDEVDQQECDPRQYVAVTGVTVRRHADLQSPKVGVIKRGQVATVTHTKQLEEGILRLRCAAGGWVSASLASGKVRMIPEGGTASYYRVISNKPAQVGEHLEVGKCTETVGLLTKGTVIEALEIGTDQSTQQMRIRTNKGWISEMNFNLVATPDPFCVIDAVPVEGSAAPQAARVAQQVKTKVQEDNLQPHWNHPFDIKVFPSSGSFSLSVRNGQRKSQVMGSATISLVDQDGIPGAALSGTCLSSPTFEMSTEPAQVTVALTDEEGAPAGAVIMLLAYAPTISREELDSARDTYGDDWRAGIMVEETIERTYKFRSMTEAIRRSWLSTLVWTAAGCPGYPATPPASLPPAPILDAELQRVTRDISLLTLPLRRTTMLLNGLYSRRVMGKHKPRFRSTAYTIFNLELHAWSVAGHTSHKAHPFVGVPLRDLRGINFHKCLERLCLLHYGKQRCLSYEELMREYNTEIQHVSLQMITSCIAQWLARRRVGKTVGGESWPWFEVWREHPTIFNLAAKGAFISRLRTLQVLRKEIERHSRPELLDEPLLPRERLVSKGGGNRCSCVNFNRANDERTAGSSSPRSDVLTREHFAEIRLEDFTDGSGGEAGIDDVALRSALATVVVGGYPLSTVETDRIIGLAKRGSSTAAWITEVLDSSPLAPHADDEDSDLEELAKDTAQLEAELFPPVSR